MSKILIIGIGILAFCGVLTAAINRTNSHCFRFTWLGPEFHNQSIFLNATCQVATRLASGIPCEQPLVVSENGTWPDVDYIWTHYADKATCVLADSDVCAQYTYYFNGRVLNSTYMCTRAIDSNNTAITSGCFQEVNGSFATKVCICRSLPGGVPCNSASTLSEKLIIYIIFVFPFIFNIKWLSVLS